MTALAPRKWAKVLPFALDMAAGTATTIRPTEAVEQLADTVLAYRVALPPEATTLLVFPRLVGLMVVAGLLGDSAGALTERSAR